MSTKEIKVSVVVPIYNVERYLRKCLDSIVNQTLKELEIICIDDGSTDASGQILDEYVKKDSRIAAIHQTNRGYSGAVNRGIELARGEYIGIIESDDWIEPDMYAKLYQSTKGKPDIVKGEFFVYNSTLPAGKQDVLYQNPGIADLELAPDKAFSLEEWPALLAYHASLWSSIYKADFLKAHPVPESAGASYQDLPLMTELLLSARNIRIVKQPFVHWRNDPNQTHSTSAKGKKLLLMAKNTLLALDSVKQDPRYIALAPAFFAGAFWANISFFHRIDRQYKPDYYTLLQEIFSPILELDDFDYRYFRAEDIPCVKSILSGHGWRRLDAQFIVGGVKRRIGKILKP